MSKTMPLLLAVEDDPILRIDFIYVAEAAGYDTIEASSADEALEILEMRDDIRVVFTDINMPGSLDGLGLAKRIQELWPQTIIVVCSGNAAPAAGLLPPGATFVPKPCSGPRVEGLLDSIRSQIT